VDSLSLVSTGEAKIPKQANFPAQVDEVLLRNNRFHRVARDLRERVIQDPQFANEIRWRPAYKQLLYGDDTGRLIVMISQNSVGNAIAELLGIVVKRPEKMPRPMRRWNRRWLAVYSRRAESSSRLIWVNLYPHRTGPTMNTSAGISSDHLTRLHQSVGTTEFPGSSAGCGISAV
jgi:hypothetical protein